MPLSALHVMPPNLGRRLRHYALASVSITTQDLAVKPVLFVTTHVQLAPMDLNV